MNETFALVAFFGLAVSMTLLGLAMRSLQRSQEHLLKAVELHTEAIAEIMEALSR